MIRCEFISVSCNPCQDLVLVCIVKILLAMSSICILLWRDKMQTLRLLSAGGDFSITTRERIGLLAPIYRWTKVPSAGRESRLRA